jgi:hypothetical protein
MPGVNYFVRSASIILAGLLTRVFWVDFSSVGGGYAIVMGGVIVTKLVPSFGDNDGAMLVFDLPVDQR